MSKELLTELGHKNEVFKRWNQQQVAQEEYGLAVPSCGNEGRKVKANQELPEGAGDVKENNIGFHNYIISKRKTTEWAGELETKDTEEVKVLNMFFDSILTNKNGLQGARET